MDGFAVIAADTILATEQNPIVLRISDSIAAGTLSERRARLGSKWPNGMTS